MRIKAEKTTNANNLFMANPPLVVTNTLKKGMSNCRTDMPLSNILVKQVQGIGPVVHEENSRHWAKSKPKKSAGSAWFTCIVQ